MDMVIGRCQRGHCSPRPRRRLESSTFPFPTAANDLSLFSSTPSSWLLFNASRLCMDSPTTSLTSTATSVFESATAVPEIPPNDSVPAHHANPVVAFIIGLAIILLASILNAAGLNLTKLDHVSSPLHSC